MDKATTFITTLAINQRVYPMFAFLFGYGMVQFYNSRVRRGLADRAVRKMLWRRHWAMIGLGLVHFFLLFEGDILAAYGLVGLITIALWFRRRDKTTFAWFWVFIGLPVLLASLVATAAWLVPDLEIKGSAQGAGALGLTTSVANPDYLAGLVGKIPLLLGYPAQVVLSPIVPCVLLGWLAARRGILENPGQHRRLLTTMAVVGLLLAWLCALPGALANLNVAGVQTLATALTLFNMLAGVAGGLGYVAVFALLATRWQDATPRAGRLIAAIGQRSMSSYLLQSVLFAPLLCAWGFGLGDGLGAGWAALIALAVWGCSLLMSALLDAQGRRGPAETLLRKITYGRAG